MSTDISTREGLFKVMAQIAAEREAAKPIVAELLQRDEPPWDDDIPQEWKTAGFVDELTKAAAGILEKDPAKTLSLLHFAFGLCSNLHDRNSSIVAMHLNAVCLKHTAYTHQFQGSLNEAARAIKVAIRNVDDVRALDHEQTNANFVLAGVLMRQRRFDEAVAVLRRCEERYTEFGDRSRLVRCQILWGAIANTSGDYQSAIERLSAVVTEASQIEDVHTRMTAHENLAIALHHTGRQADAIAELDRARGLAASMPSELDRVDWVRAGFMIDTGDREQFVDALDELRRIRAAFLERQMIDDAGLVGLDMVDLLVALERREEARDLTEDVIAELAHPGLETFASRALAYLRELIPASPKARAAIRHVKSYVLRARSTLSVEAFSPLDDN